MKANPSRLNLECLEDRANPSAEFVLDNGVLRVEGSDQADRLFLNPGDGGTVVVVLQSGATTTSATYLRSQVQSVAAALHGGNDTMVNNTDVPTLAEGGDGNDSLWGGSGNDTLSGGPGADSIYG